MLDITEEKTCTRCNQTKPLTEFAIKAERKDGRATICKSCLAAYRRKKYQEQEEPVPIPEIKRCPQCQQIKPASDFRKDKLNGLSSWCISCFKNRYNTPDANRKHTLKRAYGLSVEQFEQMRLDQNGLCAICHQEPPHGRQGLVVDHDHKTGKVRGLLCNSCNRLLGSFEDGLINNAEFAQDAQRYLHQTVLKIGIVKYIAAISVICPECNVACENQWGSRLIEHGNTATCPNCKQEVLVPQSYFNMKINTLRVRGRLRKKE